ncbi:hypothetical protein H9K76_03730 [Diaphorobacter ruginosibacter]|uniref:Uncharacterized protein n=1 Tax=Diaphorobacter ruginosibacter TaxID=1715720 RepID=A0A7G9RQX1_9BURK|nr:hypothetical protein [Diaphorobacter ruginosibacter]QNN57996.1 hypothetical protein H9K76_03730 [Diaphorobacter ruginosibacter]
MKQFTNIDLESEAKHLHRCLFRKSISSAFIKAYEEAHKRLPDLQNISVDESRTLHIISTRQLNAVAIEPWLRGKKQQRHALSAKLLLVSYIAECDGKHPGYSRQRQFGRGIWIFLLFSGFFGLLYGLYLKVRHGLL